MCYGGERFSDTWPLTGMKGELLEGGIRVPLIVSWPAHLPQGQTSGQVAISMDALPTLVAAAGGETPDYPLDGISLLPFLRAPELRAERRLFWRHKAAQQAAVRQGNWKYLRFREREYLFDLAADERERADRKALRPDIFAALRAAHAAWNAQMLRYPELSFSETMVGKMADRPE